MVTRMGGGSRQMVTNGDKGGRGVKNRDFYGDILFEWPYLQMDKNRQRCGESLNSQEGTKLNSTSSFGERK